VFAAVAADRRVLDPEAIEQLQRLGEVARRHLHVVAVLAQQLDHRAHHEHVRAVGEVYPNAHPIAHGSGLGDDVDVDAAYRI
jgi:hypothetical protein